MGEAILLETQAAVKNKKLGPVFIKHFILLNGGLNGYAHKRTKLLSS